MKPDQETDVIARVLDGETSAYAEIVDAYKKPVVNLAYRMTGSYDDALDLAQETFLKAYSQLGRFDRRKRFFTWLYTISLNLIRNHLKRKARAARREDQERALRYDSWQANGADPESVLIKRQRDVQIYACLQALSPDLREAVVLRFFQELPFETLADILDISPGAAKMRVYRGLERLTEIVDKS
jgi:RNA polymerase sigma-70 factor, ECF subfamily